MNFALTLTSGNRKTGTMPVSTSHKGTCPQSCPFKSKGCYAKGGALNIHWTKVSEGERGYDWNEFLIQIKKNIGRNEIWRHNQSGDLIGKNNQIDRKALTELVNANKGKRGFSYTHYPLTPNNLKALKNANDSGFTINVSTNHISEVDKAMESGLPVVTVLPYLKDGYSDKVLKTDNGNTVLICPASLGKEITCKSCTLCQKRDRSFAIGFIAHGNAKNHIGK